jgi:hypothetical protein
VKSYPAKELRIPTIATTHSDRSIAIRLFRFDRDQCGAMTGIADCCARAAPKIIDLVRSVRQERNFCAVGPG